jgi:hypothetical protein
LRIFSRAIFFLTAAHHMNLSLGPLRFRAFAGDNWSSVELAYVSRDEGGLARRETAVRAGFKSEHAIASLGADNPADTFECPNTGTLYFGKLVKQGNAVHAISAKQVYTAALMAKVEKDATAAGLRAAEEAKLAIPVA